MSRTGWMVFARLTCAAVGLLYFVIGLSELGESSDSPVGFIAIAVGGAMIVSAMKGPNGIGIYFSLAGCAVVFFLTLVAAILPILCENSDDCGKGIDGNVLAISGLVSGIGFFLTLLLVLRDWPRRPPAAWYADPHEPDTLYRYWDGRRWTEHRAPQ